MSILWPSAVGKPGSTVLFSRGTKAYAENAGLDRDHKGYGVFNSIQFDSILDSIQY